MIFLFERDERKLWFRIGRVRMMLGPYQGQGVLFLHCGRWWVIACAIYIPNGINNFFKDFRPTWYGSSIIRRRCMQLAVRWGTYPVGAEKCLGDFVLIEWCDLVKWHISQHRHTSLTYVLRSSSRFALCPVDETVWLHMGLGFGDIPRDILDDIEK